MYWYAKNHHPNQIVVARLQTASFKWLYMSASWAQVILTPLLRRMIVFKRGTLYIFMVKIPTGGHCRPTSGEGSNAESKYLQKNLKKNITSLRIKRR